jgi:hypothetical protein
MICNGNFIYIQSVTEISTLILTSNRTRHDEQFFYVGTIFSKSAILFSIPPPLA